MENNNYSPDQNGYNGQYAPGYNQPQYNGQYNGQYGAQPQYNNSYNQQYNQPYGQQYNHPYGQQYNQPYGQPYSYNQGGFTVAPQKKPVNPIVTAIPAAIIPSLLSGIYSFIVVRTIDEVALVLGVFLNLLTIAIVGGLGFITYKKPKGAAVFMSCYFLAGCAACIPTELIKAIFYKNYRVYTAMNFVALLITVALTVVAVMFYEKLKNKEDDTSSKASDNGLIDTVNTNKSLYNPLFIGVAVFAITFINRVAFVFLNTNAPLISLLVNAVEFAMVVGVGFFMSKSLKKAVEFGGYAYLAFKIAALLSSFAVGAPGALGLLLAFFFSAIGSALAMGFAFVSESAKKKNIF